MAGRIKIVKVRRLMDWDKDSLKGKAKAMHASKVKQGIPSLLPISRQPPPGQQGYLGRRMSSLWTSPSCSTSFIGWAWNHTGHILLVTEGQLSRLCPLPTACALPACSLVEWDKEQKRPWPSASTWWNHSYKPLWERLIFTSRTKEQGEWKHSFHS